MKLERHWGISLLAILAIGPGLMLNTALNAIRPVLQHAYSGGDIFTITPVLIGVSSFAFFIPFGPISRHVLGERKTYILSSCLFIIGAIICASANQFLVMDIGRFFQGMGTGLALMMMIPMLVLSFPIAKRNLALIMLIGGFYGSSVLGIFLGVCINSYGHWRVLFYIAIALSLLGLCLNFNYLTNENAEQQRKHQPALDITGTVLMFVFIAFVVITLLALQKYGLQSVYVWIGIFGSFIFLCYLFITEYLIEEPLINVRLLKLPKPILAILIAIISNASMVLSMVSLQNMLKMNLQNHSIETLLIYLSLIVGVAIVTALTTMLYDKLGPGILGLVGGVFMVAVNLFWTFTSNHVPVYGFVISFAVLVIGVGLTFAAGLMGAALGGPLPTLVPRMVAVQFIRIAMNSVIPVCISVALKQMNYSQNSTSTFHTSHTFAFLSCIASVLIMFFSFLMFLTGKGHKLAHRPHDVATNNDNEERKQTVQLDAHKEHTNEPMKDAEFRKSLRTISKQSHTLRSYSETDDVFRKGLKKMTQSTKE